jgi:hypothetical protein
MITGLDHLVVLLGDIKAGAKAYELLLGRAPSWRSQNDDAETVLFTLDNMTLELMAPVGASAAADRIRSVIKIWGEGLASICFRVGDIEKMHRRLDRLALKPEPIAQLESRDTDSGGTLRWKRTRAATEMTRGVRMFFLELAEARPHSAATAAAPILGLDHVVVSTEDPERRSTLWRAARARYGARPLASGLGPVDVLPLRRSDRRGGAPAGRRRGPEPRQVVGIELARRRHRRDAGAAAAAGLDVSEVRVGRKPGTRVLSVRDGTCGIHTLLLERTARA